MDIYLAGNDVWSRDNDGDRRGANRPKGKQKALERALDDHTRNKNICQQTRNVDIIKKIFNTKLLLCNMD